MRPLVRLGREALGLLSLLVLCSCSSSHGLQSAHSPGPRPDVSCEDSGNLAAKLGATLFFDARLSGDRSLACASCHDPELQFTDGRALAIGFAGKELRRHSPVLVNLGRGRSFFWDGRVQTLESQARAVIENPGELNSSLELVVERLKRVPHYRDRFAAI